MALSRREASLRPARARRSRDHFGTVGPVQASPTIYIYMCQWARRLSHVKLAVICGVRSALRRWPCSYCEHRGQLIHYVRKHNLRFNIHTQGETTFIFPTFQATRHSTDGCFWPAREGKDSRALHKRRQRSWNMARGGKAVRAGHRLGGGVGGWGGDK